MIYSKMRRMNALALPALCFFQMLSGIFLFPMMSVYADFGPPLETVIGQMNSLYPPPSPFVLFIGHPDHFTPSATSFYPEEFNFIDHMAEESRRHAEFYGLVIIETPAGAYSVRLSQILSWAHRALKTGGYLVLYDFKENRYVMAVRKEHP